MLIGIHGKKRSGKDTAARFIRNYEVEQGGNAEIYSLAFPIKLALDFGIGRQLGLTFDDFDGKTTVNRDEDLFLVDIEMIRECLRWLHLSYNKISIAEYTEVTKIIESLDYNEPWTIRRMMQTLGTDIMVSVNKNYWLLPLMKKSLNKDIIIPDIRQTHEIEFVREFGKMMFVYRDTNLCDNHITERGLTPLEHEPIIHNDATLAALSDQVLTTYKELKCKNKFNNCKRN
ncbi:gp1 dNMP kinase [Aeromonas phage Aeh1]|uniref:Gp1 dNMP kinase n=1 Tax=Aeromonas phage Aeh1 TaxID=2880362 RepID=Q76YP5_9CAUD|nr:deoxynucleoside monophosphate kinase [Aeromonas phage Aeh1]AAQ17851.1 gp1 dNMP kinase [Aeromonas phage Aeh1]